MRLCFRIVWGYTEITPIMEYYDVIKNIVQSILQHVKGYQITILIFSHHHHSLRRSEAILSPVALRINNFKKTLSLNSDVIKRKSISYPIQRKRSLFQTIHVVK